MEYKEYNNINNFLDTTREILLASEAENGLMLGIAELLKADPNYYGTKPLLATVSSSSGIELVVMMTPPFKIQIIACGNNSLEAVETLTKNIGNSNWYVPGVIAEKNIAETFAKNYCEKTGRKLKIVMSMRIFKLTEVAKRDYPEGNFRVATMDDFDLCLDWTKKFMIDCFGENSNNTPDDSNHLEDKIKSGFFYLWEKDKPVSMAARTRPTPNSECVASVYTPPDERGKGYATAVVSELSKEILKSGKKFCTLFTDLANPTSNSIYQKIGYKPIADICDCMFK